MDWGEVAIVRMIAASSSQGHDKLMKESDIKMSERKYIIPPDEDSDEDDNDAEEITLSEMEVDDEEEAQSADEETAGRDEEQNENRNEEESENMELLEVSTGSGGWEEGDLGSDLGVLEPEVELLEVSSEEVDLGSNQGDNMEGEFDPDEDIEEALVIDEEDDEGEGRDENKSGGSDEYKPLELLPAGWKFKETPRHDGGKKVFFPQYPM